MRLDAKGKELQKLVRFFNVAGSLTKGSSYTRDAILNVAKDVFGVSSKTLLVDLVKEMQLKHFVLMGQVGFVRHPRLEETKREFVDRYKVDLDVYGLMGELNDW